MFFIFLQSAAQSETCTKPCTRTKVKTHFSFGKIWKDRFKRRGGFSVWKNPHLSRGVYLFNLGLVQETDIVEGNAKVVCDVTLGHQGLEKVTINSKESSGTGSGTSSSSILLPDAVFHDWWDSALIKVDTEGAEGVILKRFLKHIERRQVRSVVIEVVTSLWP